MNKKKMISADLLKWIALITMFIDHIGAGILEKSSVFMSEHYQIDYAVRSIGRLAFPIFCFLIVEGYDHTRSRYRYARNLIIFALISEIPFDMLFWVKYVDMDHQNVYFTLFIGLMTIIGMGYIEQKNLKVSLLLELPVAALGAFIAYLMKTDYGEWGIVLIAVIFITRRNRLVQCLVTVMFMITSPFYMDISLIEALGALSFILVGMYNGERKGTINKYVFYSLYPVHMLLYCGIRYLL